MEPIATISGLATGIDFRGLVDQIIEAESRPLIQIQRQIDKVSVRSAAWEDFRSRIGDLRAAASQLSDGTAFRRFTTSVNSNSTVPPFSVSAGPSARPGQFEVQVLQLATREKLGSDYFSSKSDALGLSGEFLLGGQRISVGIDDSLEDIAAQANAAAGGTRGSGVTASVVETTPGVFRLMFTAAEAGAVGVNATDGADGVLRSLGFMGAGVGIKHATSDGALSDAFETATDPLGALLNFSTAPAAGTVDIGSVSVSLDLSTMSLTDVADAINAESGGGNGVRAEVVSETVADGSTRRRLDISGTTSFSDAGGILESLGIVTGDRGAVAQEMRSNAFTDRNPNRIADAGTRLDRLWLDGEDADVSNGDTLTITGTRADGSSFETSYTVGNGDEFQDLLDVLNSDIDGFQAGTATATASINEFGQLVVTDDTGGGSLLDLQIVSNNEGGGRLDFGEFEIGTTGRQREVVNGVDSRLSVDGNFVTRSSNSISDVIDGVTLNLAATTEAAVGASVAQDTTQIVEELQAFVDAYNAITEFVGGQFSGAGAAEGAANAPLSGDSTVLQMRNLLRGAMNTLIDPAVGGLRGLFAVGIEVDRDGVFTLDEAKLTSALASDPTSVERLFMQHGAGSVATIGLVSASGDVAVGDYLIDVTQAASRAVIDGLGFGGSYSDDGTPDTLRIVDTGSGGTYDVALADGMSMDDIVAAINAEFGTRLRHRIEGDTGFFSDSGGTVADDATLLADLHDAGGANQGVANGDVITISGMTAEGVSIFTQFTVTDASTQTLGDLRQQIADSVGSGSDVTLTNGVFGVENVEAGLSLLSLSISSDNVGGGTLSFGTFNDATAGRGIADVTASNVDGQLRLSHDLYGSGNGIEVSFIAGGGDGSSSLGLATGTYTGTDVVGTINGLAATGIGELLRGDPGSEIEGLAISYTGSAVGAVGSLTFSRGVGAAMERVSDILLSTGPGSIDEVVSNLDVQTDLLNDRLIDMEQRLERRRENLIMKFARLEEAVAIAQSQSDYLAGQLATLSGLASQRSQ